MVSLQASLPTVVSRPAVGHAAEQPGRLLQLLPEPQKTVAARAFLA